MSHTPEPMKRVQGWYGTLTPPPPPKPMRVSGSGRSLPGANQKMGVELVLRQAAAGPEVSSWFCLVKV